MSFRPAQIISSISFFASIACGIASIYFTEQSTLLIIIAAVLLAAYIAVLVLWVRCPSCDRIVIHGMMFIQKCPHCGKPLYRKGGSPINRKYR